MDTISKHHSSAIALERSERKARRYYRREQKLRIVEESLAPGASVSVLARKHDINANILFAWRRQYKRGQLHPVTRKSEPALLPIVIGSDTKAASEGVDPQAWSGHIEIHLADGRWIHVSGSVETATLRTVLAELTRS